MRRLEELWQIMGQLDHKRTLIAEDFHEEERAVLSKDSPYMEEYLKTFQKLDSNIRALCVLLSFFKKKIEEEFDQEN